jgi:hypothetical protein
MVCLKGTQRLEHIAWMIWLLYVLTAILSPFGTWFSSPRARAAVYTSSGESSRFRSHWMLSSTVSPQTLKTTTYHESLRSWYTLPIVFRSTQSSVHPRPMKRRLMQFHFQHTIVTPYHFIRFADQRWILISLTLYLLKNSPISSSFPTSTPPISPSASSTVTGGGTST